MPCTTIRMSSAACTMGIIQLGPMDDLPTFCIDIVHDQVLKVC